MNGVWIVTLALTLPLAVLAYFVTYVAWRLHKARSDGEPEARYLFLTSRILDGLSIGMWAAVILGVNSVFFNLTGIRLMPSPLPAVGIYIAVIAGAIAVMPLYRQIRRWDRDR